MADNEWMDEGMEPTTFFQTIFSKHAINTLPFSFRFHLSFSFILFPHVWRPKQIHSRKMNVDLEDVNFEELSRSCDDFNGAQVKAICVEAGMLALRREASIIKHEDFMEAIAVVSAKKKGVLDYYA
mmetsp:Transcript_25617/g.51408  ORF Transcript_25617/g.51408 Transcript_25617/m.51408 type:complete len:126 (+) Transcript_25617:1235-1612(+)